MEALKTQITRNHSNDTATFQKLMQKINELRALGSSHSLHLQWFRSNWLRLHLPPLFAEIWDIPLPKSTPFASATSSSSNNNSVIVVSQSSISPRDHHQQQQQQQQANSSPQLNNATMASPIENWVYLRTWCSCHFFFLSNTLTSHWHDHHNHSPFPTSLKMMMMITGILEHCSWCRQQQSKSSWSNLTFDYGHWLVVHCAVLATSVCCTIHIPAFHHHSATCPIFFATSFTLLLFYTINSFPSFAIAACYSLPWLFFYVLYYNILLLSLLYPLRITNTHIRMSSMFWGHTQWKWNRLWAEVVKNYTRHTLLPTWTTNTTCSHQVQKRWSYCWCQVKQASCCYLVYLFLSIYYLVSSVYQCHIWLENHHYHLSFPLPFSPVQIDLSSPFHYRSLPPLLPILQSEFQVFQAHLQHQISHVCTSLLHTFLHQPRIL